MKSRVQEAVKRMTEKVDFDPVEHVYVEKTTGMWLQGVSTVSSIMPKEWLAAWGAKEAVKALGYSDYKGDTKLAIETLETLRNCSLETYLKILKEAKGAARRKSGQALIDGKSGHEWLENFVSSRIRGDTPPAIPFTGFLERPILQFMAWEQETVKEWLASEAIVCDTTKGYAGTLDAIALLKTGELALIDFKFANQISEDYYLQLAGYGACFEPYHIWFDKRIILRLPKTLERDEWNEREFKYEKKPNMIEIHEVTTDFNRDRDIFYSLIEIRKWINQFNKN